MMTAKEARKKSDSLEDIESKKIKEKIEILLNDAFHYGNDHFYYFGELPLNIKTWLRSLEYRVDDPNDDHEGQTLISW